MPADALRFLGEVGLSAADREKIMAGNARKFFGLDAVSQTAPERELLSAR